MIVLLMMISFSYQAKYIFGNLKPETV